MMLASLRRCLSFSFNAKCLNDFGAVTCLVLVPCASQSEANVGRLQKHDRYPQPPEVTARFLVTAHVVGH